MFQVCWDKLACFCWPPTSSAVGGVALRRASRPALPPENRQVALLSFWRSFLLQLVLKSLRYFSNGPAHRHPLDGQWLGTPVSRAAGVAATAAATATAAAAAVVAAATRREIAPVGSLSRSPRVGYRVQPSYPRPCPLLFLLMLCAVLTVPPPAPTVPAADSDVADTVHHPPHVGHSAPLALTAATAVTGIE